MEIISIIAFLITGCLAGLVAGLLGLSGGVITVPCLVLIFHLIDFPQEHLMHTAIGTSLAAMVINGIASVTAHHRRQGVIWDVAFAMIPGLILGCMLGSFLSSNISGVILQDIFGLFICLLGAYVLLGKKKMKETNKPSKTLFTWIGLVIGTLASMLGIGGGVFTVPLLISYRYPEKKAVGTSASVSLFITTLAAFAYLYYGMKEVTSPMQFGYIYLPAFALIGFASIFFAPLGAKLAHNMDGKKLRRIFAATLIITGILMVIN